MKSGSSSLNPYAASYVPLFKRGFADVSKEFNWGQEFNTGNEFVQHGHQPTNTFPQGRHHYSQSYAQTPNPTQTAQSPKRKDHRVTEFVASTSQFPNEISEKLQVDEDFDIDLAYLQMTFPEISDVSLSDVYLANRCDLDATIDMLTQLEIHPDDSSGKLPDSLDIGDVPESHEVKNTKAEASKSGLPSNMPSKG